MNTRLFAILMAITLLAGCLSVSAWQTGTKIKFADARVESAVQMCRPYMTLGSGKTQTIHFPEGWSSAGKPCSDAAAINLAKQAGYRWMDSYWLAQVSASLVTGKTVSGQISTLGKPLVFFKAGEIREPDATRGLKYEPIKLLPPETPDPRHVEHGDTIPVSFVAETGESLTYAPNELEHTQNRWIWAGFAILIIFVMFLFAPDTLPLSEEDKRYAQAFWEKHCPEQSSTTTY